MQALRAATEGLRLMTPLTALEACLGPKWPIGAHGGMMPPIWTMAIGVPVLLMVWRRGTPPHLYHMLDFGPDYKISAYDSGLKIHIFADRLANSTVYGSNDKMNWTRSTPGVTAIPKLTYD